MKTIIFSATFDDTVDQDQISERIHDAACTCDERKEPCPLEAASSSWVTHDEEEYVDVNHNVINYKDMEGPECES